MEINLSVPQLTEKNWYICKCEQGDKYMFGVGNEPLYSGTYVQCLIVLGGLMQGNSLQFIINFAQVSFGQEELS